MTTVPFHQKTSAATLVAQLRSDSHAPISAMIEVADRCNEVCVHCYQVQGTKGELRTEQWKTILDELAEMGVLFLTISGGEATLRSDFLELVEYAREKRFAVKLFTNGLTMTPELAQRLAELAVQEVQISLYSHRAELHDWVTGVTGSWEKTVAGAKALMAVGVAVLLKTPLMTVNAPDYRDYVRFVSDLGADFMLSPQVNPREDGDRSPERLRVDEHTFLTVKRDPLLVRTEHSVPGKNLARSVCGACSGNVHIEANGELRPCTQLTVPVGNALREGVRAAWTENADARAIRELTWRDLHGCRACDLQPYCSRCFANAKREVGDALAPYPNACTRARLKWELVHGHPPRIVVPKAGSQVGPYRQVDEGVFEAVDAVVTPDDEERARRLGWTREAPVDTAAVAPVLPGQLVQIRRPGARSERAEQVPRPGVPAPVR